MEITDKQFSAAVERFPIVAGWGRKGVQELADILEADHIAKLQKLREALEPLVGHSRFIDVSDDRVSWWCTVCDAEEHVGNELKHEPDCLIGKARAALGKD